MQFRLMASRPLYCAMLACNRTHSARGQQGEVHLLPPMPPPDYKPLIVGLSSMRDSSSLTRASQRALAARDAASSLVLASSSVLACA